MKWSSFTIEALTRRRPLENATTYTTTTTTSTSEQNSNASSLKRRLTATDLIFYGVGCSVGAGIYSLVGIGARTAGPSISLSFAVAGVACCLTSLAYSEFAARVQTAGSAYTFTYVAFGELCGWLVGWNLTLGYAVSAAVVARSWAEYLVGFLVGYGIATDEVELWLTKFPLFFGADHTCCPLSMVIIAICTLVLVTGVKESARFNTIMTLLNLSVLCFVLLAGVKVVDHHNLIPVFPHGVTGMAQGAGLVFFAYLGFDMVSCLSEEVQEPARNMPIGIIGSLAVSMSIYFAISLVVVGMAPTALLGEDVPIVNALLANACCGHSDQLLENAQEACLSYSCEPVLYPLLLVGSRIVSFGAIFGLTTATFTCLMGQPRIFYSMAKDGLFLKIYGQVNPKTGVPTKGTIITGIFTACVACLIDLESLANAISLGTLAVFTFVNAGVVLLRLQQASSPGPPPLQQDASPVGPPVTDPRAAAMARSLGLIDETSEEIRAHSMRGGFGVADDENETKAVWLLAGFTISALLTTITLSRGWFYWTMLCVVMLGLCTVALLCLPQYPPPETFACPMVPTVPLLGIVCNSYMMGSMPTKTWSFLGLWLVVGLLVYFGYGIHHSELRVRSEHESEVLLESRENPTKHENYRSI